MFQIALPIAVLVLGGLAYRKASKKEGSTKIGADGVEGLTPEHAIVYQNALRTQDPAGLLTMAKAFRAEGYEPQAAMLEKRARIRSLPPAIKAGRKEAFRRAMRSTNREGVMHLADIYEDEGATGAADSLRSYAQGLPERQVA